MSTMCLSCASKPAAACFHVNGAEGQVWESLAQILASKKGIRRAQAAQDHSDRVTEVAW